MDLNGLYVWVEQIDMGSSGPQYKEELRQYAAAPGMIFQLDQSYEEDQPTAVDNTDHQWIRRKNYDGLLSGCTGTSFQPGTLTNQATTFKNWQPLMSTEGMVEAGYTFALFDSRPWWLLEPDANSQTVIAGRGTFGDVNYVTAARARDGSTVMAYLPAGGAITVAMGQVSSSTGTARACWYNPRAGQSTLVGTFPTSGSHVFSAPDGQDWVLVLDDDALGRRAPGQ